MADDANRNPQSGPDNAETRRHGRRARREERDSVAPHRALLERLESIESLVSSLAESAGDARELAAKNAEIADLREERAELLRKLEAAESTATQAAAAQIDRREVEDLRRRFELAVHDVRELKSKNAELIEEVDQLRKTGQSRPTPAPAIAFGQKLDWESQKRALLEQLESEGPVADSARQTDRLTIESTIRITDEVVAEKDREIAELQRVLENQSNNLGGVAVGAAAIAGMLDQDELVRHERERLKEVQDQLRTTEIALSVERAQIARKAQEYEAKLQEMEAEKNRRGAGGEEGKRTTGNWFARLGLGERRT